MNRPLSPDVSRELEALRTLLDWRDQLDAGATSPDVAALDDCIRSTARDLVDAIDRAIDHERSIAA